MLNQQQIYPEAIEFFQERGYVRIEDFFGPQDMMLQHMALRRHANHGFSPIHNPHHEASLLDQEERPISDLTLLEVKETSQFTDQLSNSPHILAAAKDLIGEDLQRNETLMVFGEAYSEYSRNFSSLKEKNKLIAIWFFANTDEENGLLSIGKDSSIEIEATENTIVFIDGNLDYSFHPNNSGRSRPYIVYGYNNDSVSNI